MLRTAILGLFATAALTAQSPLTTTFLNNNGGSVGGGIYFDLNPAVALQITGLDLNLTGTGSINVFTTPGTRVGQQLIPAAWTQVSSGTVTGAVAGAMSPVAITPFVLPAGSVGIALQTVGVAHNYTNGTGTNQNYFTTELALAAGEANNTAFSTALFTPRVVNTRIHYAVVGTGTVFATNTTLGTGCITVADVSSYENFATAPAFDLSNTAMTWLRTSTGYLAIPGITTYQAPSGAAQVLALGDDTEANVTLSQPMPFSSTSSTSTLTVCSNGFISSGSGNGTGFTPTPATFLAGTRAWWSIAWHDYNPSIVGSGQVKFEQIGNIAYITWDGVWDYLGTGAANANTFQAQFEVNTGHVHIVYQTMSTLGNGFLVGYSDAGPSADPGSMDISAALPGTYSAATFAVSPVTLAATSRPIMGTNWNLNVTNVSPAGNIGLDLFGISDPNFPDLSLVGLGQPGCQWRATLDIMNAWFVAGPTHGYSFAVPNVPSALNFHLFTQSVVMQFPNLALNLTSNGIDGKIGDF